MLTKVLARTLLLATLLLAGCAATPGQPIPRCRPDQYVNASCSGGPPI